MRNVCTYTNLKKNQSYLQPYVKYIHTIQFFNIVALFIRKIGDGVTFDKLLEQIRDNVENVYDPKALLTKRDFINIHREYDLVPGRQHSSDVLGMKLWIDRM